jgi:hypothetical protein
MDIILHYHSYIISYKYPYRTKLFPYSRPYSFTAHFTFAYVVYSTCASFSPSWQVSTRVWITVVWSEVVFTPIHPHLLPHPHPHPHIYIHPRTLDLALNHTRTQNPTANSIDIFTFGVVRWIVFSIRKSFSETHSPPTHSRELYKYTVSGFIYHLDTRKIYCFALQKEELYKKTNTLMPALGSNDFPMFTD